MWFITKKNCVFLLNRSNVGYPDIPYSHVCRDGGKAVAVTNPTYEVKAKLHRSTELHAHAIFQQFSCKSQWKQQKQQQSHWVKEF